MKRGLELGMAWSFGMVRAGMWKCCAQQGRHRQGVPCSGSEDPGPIVMAAPDPAAIPQWCQALAIAGRLAVPR
jgi:hypothetical protein